MYHEKTWSFRFISSWNLARALLRVIFRRWQLKALGVKGNVSAAKPHRPQMHIMQREERPSEILEP